MKSWLTALCAAVFVLVGTGCGNECTDRFDCTNQKGTPPEGKEHACVANKCVTREITCSPECAENQFCEITPGQRVCRTCTAELGCAEGYTCDPALDNGAGVCLAPAPITSEQIASFLDAGVGTLDAPLPIEGAYVTYLKPAAMDGGTETGFFLQAEPDGPAMFVSDTTALPSVKVGDRVNLKVTDKELIRELRAAKAVTGLLKLSENHPVQNLATATPPGLRVDRSEAADLVSNLAGYESELMSLTGTVAPAPINNNAGGGHTSMQITTAGIPAPIDNFRLRMPTTLSNELDLSPGCTFTLMGPMWRFNAQAQPSIYNASDITVASCPAPTVVSIAVLSATSVRVSFDRQIDPASITNAATQFTFDNGLTTTTAMPNGKQVILTTSPQAPGATYKLTVATTVKDKRGAAVGTPNTATFTSVRTIAVLGARLIVPGTGFTGATAVKIGAVEQTGFTVDSDLQITIPKVADATPLGASQPIVVTTPAGDVDAGTIPVIRLLINEVDADTANASPTSTTDILEFVEIDTGVPGFDLSNSGFSLVFINGGTATVSNDEVTYYATDLKGTTDAAGLLLYGNPDLTPPPPPERQFPRATLQNGPDAVGIYQALAATFPDRSPATATGLIDVLIHETADPDDTALLDTLLGTGPERAQIDERANGKGEAESIQRCGSLARRDARAFKVLAPTPGAANVCPAPAP
jgi:hypothetical protein